MKLIGDVSDWLSYADRALIKVADLSDSTVFKMCNFEEEEASLFPNRGN